MKIKKQYTCALLLLMDLLGGKWKIRILWHILHGDNRFSLLQKGILDITHKMLVTQLKELVDSKVIIKTVISEKPLNIEYSLSKQYQNLTPLIIGLCDLAKDYADKNGIELKDK